MFNSRIEVDKHVENCLKRINNEKERNVRSLAFAKLYYKVDDYKQARRYVQMYLSIKYNSAEAQHLLGNCLEKLGQKEAAADAYRSSLSFDPTQTSLILKLCQLLAENDIDIDSQDSGASYYCERAQILDPGNQYVQQLREKLLARSSRDPNEVTQFLLNEIENRPADADCFVRLLKHLSNNNQLKLAVNHMHLIHTSNPNLSLFLRHFSYIATSTDILLRYHRENAVTPTMSTTITSTALSLDQVGDNRPLNWQFWMLLITTLDALVSLTLEEQRYDATGANLAGISGEKIGYVKNVWIYDQMVLEAVKAMDSCPDKQFGNTLLLHHRGQVCFHLATLLFRQARIGLLRWREAVSAALPLIFAGYHVQPPDTTALWLEHSRGLASGINKSKKGNDVLYDAKALVKRWNIEASSRCSQLGYVLYALGKDRKTEMVERTRQGTTGLWREQLYKKIFVTRDYQSKIKSSFFVNSTDLLDISLRFPEPQTIRMYASAAQLQYPDSLHHLIWFYLNQHKSGNDMMHCNGNVTSTDLSFTAQYDGGILAIAELSYPFIGGSLPLSVKNLGNCAAESLNILDIQAFVYCATLCSVQKGVKGAGSKFEELDRPPLLPAAIADQLGSTNQINWLKAAFRIQRGECYFGMGTDKNELRMTLIRGIEVIRCIGNHGIDVSVLIKLAKIFQARTNKLKSHSEIEFNEARAEIYWKAAMPILERLKNNHSISYSTKRLFESQSKQLSDHEVQDGIEDGKLFYGVMYLKKKELEKALAQFENLKDPYSTYYRAQIYEIMADEQILDRKNNLTVEQRAQMLILLTHSRDCLYLTLDRLRDPCVDRSHPLNTVLSVQIESIERTLARLQGDFEAQGDGHHHEDTEIKEEGDDGECMVTARDILSKSLLNSPLTQPSYQHTYSTSNISHRLYSTPVSHNPINSTPQVPSNRLQFFPPTSAILHSPSASTTNPSLRRDGALRRDEARPSPERLDAQLRQLSLARDATNAQLMEQNRAVLDTHRALLEELKGLREGVGGLTQTVSELKGIKPAFDELKSAVEDLQSLRNLPDMVHEMKREIAEIKSNSKQQQITDEDLYSALDEEYGADFTNSIPSAATSGAGLNSSITAATLGGGLYQNIPRMAAVAAAAAAASPVQPMGGLGYNPATAAAIAAATGLYPGLYPNIYSPYGGIGIQQGNLPFVNAAGPIDPHHTGLSALTDYRNPLTHPQLSHHTYPGPPPPSAVPPSISANMQITPLNYPLPTSTLCHPQQPSFGLYSAGGQVSSGTVMTPSPLGGLGAVQLQNIFKDTASVSVGGNKFNLTTQLLPQQPHSMLSQGLSGLNLFGGIASAPSIPTVSASAVSTSSAAFSGLSFGSLASPMTAPGFTTLMTSSTTISPATSKPAPVNVVITASDPLPTPTTTQSPILSVIIPPQHIKSKQQPHNYQIPLPTNSALTAPPSVLKQPVGVVTTQGRLASVGPPIYNIVGDKKDNSFGDEINRNNPSSAGFKEYDAQPDFRPIIPLPDEIEVVTGEEDEKILFCARGKLHRYMEKDWKERGIGDIKLLQNKDGKVRILMRRELVHKICANHYITGDMQFGPKAKMDTAFVWVANDFADEKVTLEKFCIRFKTADIAAEFAVQFEKAQMAAKMQESASKDSYISVPKVPVTNLGGFAFSSTPSFKPKDGVTTTVTQSKPVEVAKSSPFAGFTFTTPKASDSTTSAHMKPVSSQKSSKSFEVEEFVPTAEFKPVISLPGLVDIKTGEENSEILFECHSKLLRFDASDKDWKERGIGEMKILKDDKIIRFLMRRGQLLKVCCNHQLLHSIEFTKMPNNPKAINWYAQDYSEGVLELQMFALKFKNEELANAFLNAITDAKNLIDSNGNVLVPNDQTAADSGEHEKKVKTSTCITPTKTSGFGDKFKLKSGSWACKNCYIHNDGKDNYCIACETPKNDSVPKKPDKTTNTSFGSGFSFGTPNTTSSLTNALSNFSFENSKNTSTTNVSNSSTITDTFGNAFKPEEGSWECNECYVRNKVGSISCSSCTTPKERANAVNPTVNTTTANTNLPSGLTFLATAGDVSNTALTQFNFGFSPGNIGERFTFGTTTGTSATTSSSFTFLSKPTTVTSKTTLAAHSTSVVPLNTPITATSAKTADFTFGSSSTHTFDFQPRYSPRKHNNSLSQSADSNASNVSDGGEQQDIGGGDGGDGDRDSSLQEEEDKIYFKPVLPLPDEVAVVTGEEEEKVVYEHKAKLFRFGEGQWKERGTGNIKILIKEGSGKARAVMRREHVHKVCLNHYITSEISYTVKNEQSWQFAAADFSEGFVDYRQFCLRFRTAQIALDFKTAIDNIIGRNSSGGSGDTIPTGAKAKTNSSDSDVIFISETQITEAERDEAIKLKLPPKFMSYRQLPDCTCEQCKIEDLYYNVDVKITSATTQQYTTVAASIITTNPTVLIKPAETLTELVQKPPSFFFGQPTTTPSNSSGSNIVFGGVSIFGNTGGSSTTSKANLFDQQSSSLFGTASEAGKHSFGTTSNTLKPFFQTTTATTAASIFSSPSSSIFGNPATSNSSIFGAGNTPIMSPASSNLFGLPASTATSLFEGGTTSKAFGGTTNFFGPSSTTTSGFFGTPTSTTSLFGTPTNIFATTSTSTNTTNIFVTSTSSTTTAPLKKKVFDTPGASASSTHLLHGDNSNYDVVENSVFGEQFKNNEDKGSAVSSALTDQSGGQLMFSAADSMSFANLAADIGATSNVFKIDSTFTFANVGAPIFAKTTTKPKATSSRSTNDDENGDTSTSGNETYDPHYEPIIPLPDEIVVTTGEENEDVKFSHGAKLFRFNADTKEWKERGFGNMKLLFNSQTGVYRLLLRRDVVHKIVLNCRVTKDLNLLPMSKSEKSYVWVAHNFLEETGQVEQEKLAAQFKNNDLACLFYRNVQEAINHMNKLSKQVESKTKEIIAEVTVQPPPPLQALPTILPQINAVQSGASFTEPRQNDDYGDEDDDEEESDDGDDADEEYDDDKNVMSSKPCKLAEKLPNGNVVILGEGVLQMYYDEECFGVRISFIEPDGEVVSNSLIGINTRMTMDDTARQCSWTSVETAHEPIIHRNLIATFETSDDANECYINYHEGRSYVQVSDIQENLPSHSDSNQ